MTRPIFFLSDFGLTDTYVGIVKAVILGIAPEARIVDLTHDLPPQDVRSGAFSLMTAAPYLPDDAVVLGVVDPGVGTARRPIAGQVDGRLFVGPDNGLFSWVTGPTPLRPMASQRSFVVLDQSRYWLPSVSATFHGRDLFGPVAAHLARGAPLSTIGTPTRTIETIPFPAAHRHHDAKGRVRAVDGEILYVDRYGNLISNLTATDLPDDPVVEVGGHSIVGLVPSYQTGTDVGGHRAPAKGGRRPIALIGSAGLLEIAVPNGSAALVLGVTDGTRILIVSADS